MMSKNNFRETKHVKFVHFVLYIAHSTREFEVDRSLIGTYLHIWRNRKHWCAKSVTEHLLSPVQERLGVLHQGGATSQPLVERERGAAAQVARLVH